MKNAKQEKAVAVNLANRRLATYQLGKHINDFIEAITALYPERKVDGLDIDHITHVDVVTVLEKLSSRYPDLTIEPLGDSYQGRSIQKVVLGSGDIHILCWSQMHGDEQTATAALLDIINICKSLQETEYWALIGQQITLHLVPMLNPDGAQLYTRENAQGIDINRDAVALQSPEAQILKGLLDSIKPLFAFNLHDQDRYYAAGSSGNPVAIALMAPPGDVDESTPLHRANAMGLIGRILNDFSSDLENKVARYDDPYTWNAFGDYATSIGVGCILIESGSQYNDPLRQTARRLNTLMLLQAFSVIAQRLDTVCFQPNYWSLPVNKENGMVDVMIRNLRVCSQRHTYHIDISLMHNELGKNCIDKMGELPNLGAFSYIESTQDVLTYHPGQTFHVTEPLVLDEQTYRELLIQGYCRFAGDVSLIHNITDLPIVRTQALAEPADYWRCNVPPSWVIKTQNIVRYVLLDGVIVRL